MASKTLKIESFLNKHTIELRPSNEAVTIIIALLKQSIQTLINLLVPKFQLPLPRLKMFESMRYKLIEGELVIILLECIFEETKDILIDINCQISSEFIHFLVDITERSARGVERSEASLLWNIDIVHFATYIFIQVLYLKSR